MGNPKEMSPLRLFLLKTRKRKLATKKTAPSIRASIPKE
jgi:hypothetical protein